MIPGNHLRDNRFMGPPEVALSWWQEAARLYRKQWLDELENSTGQRKPRMGDSDPLGQEDRL